MSSVFQVAIQLVTSWPASAEVVPDINFTLSEDERQLVGDINHFTWVLWDM